MGPCGDADSLENLIIQLQSMNIDGEEEPIEAKMEGNKRAAEDNDAEPDDEKKSKDDMEIIFSKDLPVKTFVKKFNYFWSIEETKDFIKQKIM